MRSVRWLGASLFLLGVAGCGGDGASSGSGGTRSGGMAGGGESNGGSAAGSGNGGKTAAGDGGKAAAGDGGKTAGNAGAAGNGGASELSAACAMYCECHMTNCPDQAIPGGASCGDFCQAMTMDQLACRQNMCGLVPAQPNNDHCKHSVGIDQCL